MTTLVLLRHAAHDWLGRGIAGRLPGVALNEQGRRQANQLAERLGREGHTISAIYSSPQQRALETVAALALRLKLPVNVADEFDEIDFGAWTGLTFAQLQAGAPGWREWVEQRSRAQPPGGEPFADVASRVLAGIERLSLWHLQGTLLVVSHGDVIKAALASILGLHLDRLEQFDIEPASLSVLVTDGGWSQVKRVNQTLTGPVLPL